MKHTSSPLAIEVARTAAKNINQRATSKHKIPSNLRATLWFPDISAKQNTSCQFYPCKKEFPLEHGYAYPLPIARMLGGEIVIENSPVFTFCSLQHLFDATIPLGAVVTEEGKVHSLVRH